MNPKFLWLLKQSGNVGYDENAAFVVCAYDEPDARAIAASQCADEGQDAWLLWAECERVGLAYVERGVVLASFNAG